MTKKEYLIEKYYKALCYGKFNKEQETLKAYLIKDKDTKLSKVSEKKSTLSGAFSYTLLG